MVFGDPGALPAATRYFYPGAQQVSSSPVFVRIPAAAIIKSLSIRATTAPGGVAITTVTAQKNGIDTILVVTLIGAQVTNVEAAVSVSFAAGDDLSVKVDNNGATQDVIVVVELF
jgi:hypothetical protein